jgi:hypothetical protein
MGNAANAFEACGGSDTEIFASAEGARSNLGIKHDEGRLLARTLRSTAKSRSLISPVWENRHDRQSAQSIAAEHRVPGIAGKLLLRRLTRARCGGVSDPEASA